MSIVHIRVQQCQSKMSANVSRISEMVLTQQPPLRNDTGMSDKQEKRTHFGWWFKHKMIEKFGLTPSGREAAAAAFELTDTRLRQYYQMENSDEFPPIRAAMAERVLGMAPGTFLDAWKKQPVTEPIRDNRGRRKTTSRVRIWVYFEPEQLAQLKAVAGEDVNGAVIEACEDWVASHRGSADVIEPPSASGGRRAKFRRSTGATTVQDAQGRTGRA